MKDHFSPVADAYAAFRPRYPDALVNVLAEASWGHTLVWDVGCGSGQLAPLLRTRFARVIATDVSEAQLAKAPVVPGVTYRQASAERSEIAEATVDCIVAAQAAHWFDMKAFCQECHRVGRPGALVALVTYSVMRIPSWAGQDSLSRFALSTLAPFWPPERAHVDDGYARLPFPFEPVPCPSLTMRAHWSVDHVYGYIRTWSAVSEALAAGHAHLIRAFENELRSTWGDEGARDVEWPLTIRAGRLPV